MTNVHLFSLINHRKQSPLWKSYLTSTFCTSHLEEVDGKITSHYCNQRWCNVCNSIRTSKLIDWYSPQLKKLHDPYFVTLTRPNVPGENLKSEIDYFIKTFQKISKHIRKYVDKIHGMRKLECTYNIKRDDYHPHFHLVVSTKEVAEKIVEKWLEFNPSAKQTAQDVSRCYDTFERDRVTGEIIIDDNTGKPKLKQWHMELFKYFTKLTVKTGYFRKNSKGQQVPLQSNIPSDALDTILLALKGRRIYQTLGDILKPIDENIKVDETVETGREQIRDDWYYNSDLLDWVSSTTGELLTGYKATKQTVLLEGYNMDYYRRNCMQVKKFLDDNKINGFAKKKVYMTIDESGLKQFIIQRKRKRKVKIRENPDETQSIISPP